jgi:hypothetical protein
MQHHGWGPDLNNGKRCIRRYSVCLQGWTFPNSRFSLAGPTPWTTNFLCLRYELENVGDTKIPLVYWKLINEGGTFDLAAHDRLRRALRRPSQSKEAVQGPTEIKAFRTEQITTNVWQRIEDWQANTKKAEASEQMPYFHFDRSAVLDAAAEKAIEQGLIADAEVAVIDPPSNVLPPPVADALGTSDVAFDMVSQLVQDRERLRGVTSISAKLAPKVKVEAFAPALSAMEKDPQNTEEYIKALKEARRFGSELTDKGIFFSFFLRGSVRRVFIVEHPISLHWFDPGGRHTVCIKVASYSPFPVSLDDSYCM